MKRHHTVLYRFARWAWVALAIGILVVYVGTYDSGPHHDNDIVLVVLMIALGFPLSWIGVFIIVGAIMLLDGTRLAQQMPARAALVLEWMVLFAVGYAQWFVLVPRVWRRIVARMTATGCDGSPAEGSRAR